MENLVKKLAVETKLNDLLSHTDNSYIVIKFPSFKNPVIYVKQNDIILLKTKKVALIPSEMVMIKLPKEKLHGIKGEIVVEVEGN